MFTHSSDKRLRFALEQCINITGIQIAIMHSNKLEEYDEDSKLMPYSPDIVCLLEEAKAALFHLDFLLKDDMWLFADYRDHYESLLAKYYKYIPVDSKLLSLSINRAISNLENDGYYGERNSDNSENLVH